MLKGNVRTLIEVDYNEVDRVINEFYEIDNYEVIAYEEWSNNESHTFSIEGELSKYQLETVKKLLTTGAIDHYSTRAYLDYMCAEGVIERGEYLIKVSW